MKERLLRGWTLIRILYLVLGILVIVQSIQLRQWAGILFGGYFAAMGIFAFGCAGGACYYQPGKKQGLKESAGKTDAPF